MTIALVRHRRVTDGTRSGVESSGTWLGYPVAMPEHRLPVFTRYVHQDGTSASSHHVMCPRRDHTVDADGCWTCADVTGATYDAAQGAPVLVCTPDLPVDPSVPRDAASTPIVEVMSREVHCIRGVARLDEVADLFTDLHIGSLPVVDAAGRPIGVVTKTELVRALSGGVADAGLRSVDAVMTPIAFSVSDRASVAQAAALMAVEGVHHVPVLSGEGAVVGVVSSLDIARFVGRASGYLRGPGSR